MGDVRGDVEKAEDGVLVIKRIHVKFRLRVADGDQGTAKRVHGIYATGCPLYRSVKDSIAVTSELALIAD